MKDDIQGEAAVVTGASRGLGLLLARELARHGCPLVICARDNAELQRAAGRLRDEGAQVTAVARDVTDASPQLLVYTAIERHGRLDSVVSNAGIIQVGPVQDGTATLVADALAVMALAPARLALATLPVMNRNAHRFIGRASPLLLQEDPMTRSALQAGSVDVACATGRDFNRRNSCGYRVPTGLWPPGKRQHVHARYGITPTLSARVAVALCSLARAVAGRPR